MKFSCLAFLIFNINKMASFVVQNDTVVFEEKAKVKFKDRVIVKLVVGAVKSMARPVLVSLVAIIVESLGENAEQFLIDVMEEIKD